MTPPSLKSALARSGPKKVASWQARAPAHVRPQTAPTAAHRRGSNLPTRVASSWQVRRPVALDTRAPRRHTASPREDGIMRRIARAAAVALLLASGCHLAIAPGDTTTDADAQRSVWACLDIAIAPAIDRAAQG